MRPDIQLAAPAQLNSYRQAPTGALLDLIRYEDDDRAFEELFHRYYALLCQRVRSMIDCPHRTEEIVSDVFIKMWNNRRQLAISSSLKAYLFTAVRNQAIDFLRKQARNRTVDGEIRTAVPSNYSSPEEAVIFEEVNDAVEAAIEALPPQGRHIFRLSRDEGLKYREIASLLNISIKTVETHMRRSLIFLRKELRSQMTS